MAITDRLPLIFGVLSLITLVLLLVGIHLCQRTMSYVCLMLTLAFVIVGLVAYLKKSKPVA